MSIEKPHRARKTPYGFGPSFNSLVSLGSEKYKRRLHLQPLLPISPATIEDTSYKNCQWILSRLACALRQERNRGRVAHWAYSLNRHIALLQAYRGEQKLLKRLETESVFPPN